MSFDALRWAATLKVGNAAGRSLLWALADMANKNNICTAGQNLLAERSDLSARAVFKWLAVFEQQGWISRRRRQRQTGSRTSDEITLLIPNLTAPRASNLIAPDASRRSQNESNLIAPRASCQLAPDSEVTRTRCEALTSKNNLPPNPLAVTEAEMPIRDALTDIGVTADTAEALMNAYALSGSPLDDDSVQHLVRSLDGPQPEQRARLMLEDGQGRIGGGRKRRAKAPTLAAPAAPTRRVNANAEPDLWRRCCEVAGHKPDLVGKDGGWAFDAGLVARLEGGSP